MSELNLAEGMANEIKKVTHQYDGAVSLALALGVLEIVKTELINEHKEDEDETH